MVLMSDCNCIQFVQHSNFGENIEAKQVFMKNPESLPVLLLVLAYTDESHLGTDQVKRLGT